MSTSPLATIAISTTDDFAGFKKALRSAREQTYPDLEILVLDQASQDETRQYLKHLKQEEPRLRVIRYDVALIGVATYHKILQEYRGQYLTILSPTDYLEPEFMQQAIADLNQFRQAGFWYCHTRLHSSSVGQTQLPHRGPREESGLSFIYHRLAVQTRGAFISACVFQRKLLQPLMTCPDTTNLLDLIFQLVSSFHHTVVYQAQGLHHHRYSEWELSQRYTARQYLQACDHLLKALPKWIPLKSHEKHWLKKCFSYHALQKIVYLGARDEIDFLERMRLLRAYTYLFFPYIISNSFTFSLKQVEQYLMHLLQLCSLWKQPRILRRFPMQETKPTAPENEEQYQRRVVQDMLKSVLSAMSNDIDIYLWGEGQILYAGQYFSELMNQEFTTRGLKAGSVTLKDSLELSEPERSQVRTLVDTFIKEQWLNKRPQRELFKKAQELRK